MGKSLVGLLLLALLCNASALFVPANFQWKQLKFRYPTTAASDADIRSGFYIPSVPAPIDMDYDERNDRTFVTIPRFQPGSPVTLGYFNNTDSAEPLITPYPSWDWQRNVFQCNPNRLISVYRIKIDRCNRLWVLDTGRYGDTMICPPQILAFDLTTNTLVHNYTIPSTLLESRSILVTPAVDVRDTCADTFVYVADCQAYSIIVLDVKNNLGWKASHKSMYPDSRCGTYRIQGEQFDLMDGVFGLDMDPYVKGKDRKLYYHSMSSTSQNYVYTSFLRDKNRFLTNPESSPSIFFTYQEPRLSQAAAIAIDDKGVAYFGQMTQTAIYCWNTQSIYYGGAIKEMYRNTQTMQFASGVKVVSRRGDQYVLVMTSRFQKVALASLNPNEVNFRINSFSLAEIRSQKFCEVPQNTWVEPTTCGQCII